MGIRRVAGRLQAPGATIGRARWSVGSAGRVGRSAGRRGGGPCTGPRELSTEMNDNGVIHPQCVDSLWITRRGAGPSPAAGPGRQRQRVAMTKPAMIRPMPMARFQ
ncbi:hypothetical protein [Ornithinimicrobium kibberense]|uniref:hypothetical protein n=1 Tax=Ornithinimicrobium kibberense TaxID=282060 RepID=UPI00360F8F75